MKRINSSVLLVGLACLCCWAAMTEARLSRQHRKLEDNEYMAYKDPRQPIETRINDLMDRMTLDEKVAQMAQLDRGSVTEELMKEHNIGSVLNGGESLPRVGLTAYEDIDMINKFQNWSLQSRLAIPIIYGIDAVHGHNNVYKATLFPHNVGLGVTRDPDLIKRIGAATAAEVKATGIQYAFSPCVAVCRDPRWGRCYESFSEDPSIVRQMTEIIAGLQGEVPAGQKGHPYVGGKEKVAGCAKHYVGDGGTIKGINENNTAIDRNELLKIHMPGYLDSIDKGVCSIMVSYSSLNGVKMHANHDLVTNYLKDTLKFKGFVISDWQGLDKITYPFHSNYTYSVLAGVTAGIDMFILPFNYTEFHDTVLDLHFKNLISDSRIDDAVYRILRIKFIMGLFDNPMADYTFVDRLGCQAHRDLAREAVRKSLVLLKNGKKPNTPFLPLPKKANRILVAGTHANNLGYQCGGWSITWQGVSGNNNTVGTTILGGVIATVYATTEVVHSLNPDPDFIKASNIDYAIVAVGEPPYAETKGDNLNLTIPEPGPSIISNVCSVVQCVVIVVSGRPLVIEPYLPMMDALVAAWLPGTEGQGVADVLFGDYGFTGKLARTWFKRVDQLPMNVGDKNYDPLFPFGFGITTEPHMSYLKSASVGRKLRTRKLVLLCKMVLLITLQICGCFRT
ncbi:beta-glucosidase BoGH3B isoform X1 [Rosa chinensis]|uniref:beta-glucosidase BoGH3B isoform X1 n=1 Tax=Rosa chinensis TaxID=74649 RepID=UPI001AD93082|nr:beta-glucosidase BoGH3B isoform X1 [Rosa chinensis]XP_040362836.1 beta-glucosidase BoGH3B isoform X1 [Rosa chinensis]XP_040362837.1 beta-glucosidase BoGH3B isoform X1 [Rosa chinensis]